MSTDRQEVTKSSTIGGLPDLVTGRSWIQLNANRQWCGLAMDFIQPVFFCCEASFPQFMMSVGHQLKGVEGLLKMNQQLIRSFYVTILKDNNAFCISRKTPLHDSKAHVCLKWGIHPLTDFLCLPVLWRPQHALGMSYGTTWTDCLSQDQHT